MTKGGVSEAFGLKREVCPLIHIHCKPKSKFSYLTKNQKNYNFIKDHLAVCGHYRQNRQNYHKKLDLDKKSTSIFKKVDTSKYVRRLKIIIVYINYRKNFTQSDIQSISKHFFGVYGTLRLPRLIRNINTEKFKPFYAPYCQKDPNS